jgi:hypothetical protein
MRPLGLLEAAPSTAQGHEVEEVEDPLFSLTRASRAWSSRSPEHDGLIASDCPGGARPAPAEQAPGAARMARNAPAYLERPRHRASRERACHCEHWEHSRAAVPDRRAGGRLAQWVT